MADVPDPRLARGRTGLAQRMTGRVRRTGRATEIRRGIDAVDAKLDTLLRHTTAAYAPSVSSQWDWVDDQAETRIAFSDEDYGALVTTLVLGSAGPLRLVSAEYTLGFKDAEGVSRGGFAAALAALTERGHTDGISFDLCNITPGAGMVLPGRMQLGVLPYPLVRQLTVFEVAMRWESTVTGDRVDKDIHLAPRIDPPLPGRRGVPPVRTKAEVLASRPSAT